MRTLCCVEVDACPDTSNDGIRLRHQPRTKVCPSLLKQRECPASNETDSVNTDRCLSAFVSTKSRNNRKTASRTVVQVPVAAAFTRV
jgi:hypothetical protein